MHRPAISIAAGTATYPRLPCANTSRVRRGSAACTASCGIPPRSCSADRSISRSGSGYVDRARPPGRARPRAYGRRTSPSPCCSASRSGRWGGPRCSSRTESPTTWPQWRACGSSTCNTSSRTPTGRPTTSGNTWTRRCEAARTSGFPAPLGWFTGNIGLHHVHHVAPRIPNYRLQSCHDSNVLFAKSPVITPVSGMASLRLALWDEEQHRLVRFRDVPAIS